MRELRLGLDGTRLVFPDGRPVCLGCGAEPAGTRRVWFEDVRSGAGLTQAATMEAAASGLKNRIVFDAPLCAAHRARARWRSLGTFLCFLGILGVVALMAVLESRAGRKGLSSGVKYGLYALALLPGVPMFFLWQSKDRGGLSCRVSRENDGLVLTFPEPPASAR
jgi:hypothetical protein